MGSDIIMTIFGSESVITHHIANAKLHTYFVGFDLDDTGEKVYRWSSLIDKLLEVIPEFAFGFHDGTSTSNTQLIGKVRDAARSIYKIDEFQRVKDLYLNNGHLADDVHDKYLRRGEFGELILHLLLRDFHSTVPLISKIYFKDSYGHTVHGFDAVHIEPKSKTLWLGESKIYLDGKKGVSELVKDIKEHFLRNYLNDEFTIISKKIKNFGYIPELDHWLRLLDNSTTLSEQLDFINIPLLCTYTSENFTKYNDETLAEFIKDYEEEVYELKRYFDLKNDHPLKTNLNIILLLFPVKSKIKLVKKLHNNLSLLQRVGG